MSTFSYVCVVGERAAWRTYSSFTLAACVAEVDGEWVERTLHLDDPAALRDAGLVQVEASPSTRFPKQLSVASSAPLAELPTPAVERVLRRLCRNRDECTGGTALTPVLDALRRMRVRGNFDTDFDEEEEERDALFAPQPVATTKPKKENATFTRLRDAVTHSERTARAAALGPSAVAEFLRRSLRRGEVPDEAGSLGAFLHAALGECPEIAWFGDGRLGRLACTAPAFPATPHRDVLLQVAAAHREGDSYALVPTRGVSPPPNHWPSLVVEEVVGGSVVQLAAHHAAESEIGALLASLATRVAPPTSPSDVGVFAFAGKAATRATEAIRAWAASPRALHPEQTRAVSMLRANGACVLQGAAGSGKTTVVAELCRLLGGATAARTLHSVVANGAAPTALFPSGRATLVVDECSMLSVPLLHRFLRTVAAAGVAIERLILVGDLHQLPPVAGSSVQHEAVESKVVPVVTMHTSQHRQRSDGEGAGILRTASAIIGWDGFFESTFADDVFGGSGAAPTADVRVHRVGVTTAPRYAPSPAELDACVDAALAHAREAHARDGEQMQVLAATNVVCDRLNGALRDLYNPKQQCPASGGTRLETLPVRGTRWIHRVGDRVIALKNVYVAADQAAGGGGRKGLSLAVGNGDLGEVVRVATTEATVRFLNGEEIAFGAFRRSHGRKRVFAELAPAYAVSVHKFQGSECDSLLYVNFSWKLDFMTRNLLYTALTRAKKKALLVSSVQQLSACAPWAAASKCRMHTTARAASAEMEAAATSRS